MKKILMPALLVLLVACGSKKEEGTETKTASATTTTTEAPVTYPVPTDYNATWSSGDQKNVTTLFEMLKRWTSGELTDIDKYFADSVSFYLASGEKFIGTRDSIMPIVKKSREMYSELNASVHSVIPLHHGDTKEDWVCIWLKSVYVMQGKKDSMELQEDWRFNKDGKAELLYQYMATIKPMK